MGLALLQAFSIGSGFIALVVVVLVVGLILYSAVKVVKEYERGVISEACSARRT
jgi:regulator of protease activity HflC (stomatin/prohibitin superfamily)